MDVGGPLDKVVAGDIGGVRCVGVLSRATGLDASTTIEGRKAPAAVSRCKSSRAEIGGWRVSEDARKFGDCAIVRPVGEVEDSLELKSSVAQLRAGGWSGMYYVAHIREFQRLGKQTSMGVNCIRGFHNECEVEAGAGQNENFHDLCEYRL